MAGPTRVPSRFRRRLLIALLGTSLVPMVVVAAASMSTLGRLMAISLTPIEEVLESAGEQLDRCADHEGPRPELTRAQLLLAQVELSRRAIVRIGFPVGVVVLLLGGAAAAFVAWHLGRSLVRDIAVLAEGMRQFSDGTLEYQVPEPAHAERDEVGYLIRAFNRMGKELLAHREQLRLLERMRARHESARTLAHELRNPLTAMSVAIGRIERAEQQAPSERQAAAAASEEALRLLKDELRILKRMAQGFAEMGKLPPGHLQAVRLGPLLEANCALYRSIAPVAIECQEAIPWQVQGDADQLRRLFGNLVKNAAEASCSGDEPIRVAALAQADRVQVTVSDGGAGVSDELLQSDLLRGVPSNKPGGMGLGLRLSASIAQDHGGVLSLGRRTPKGTCAVVELPLWEVNG